MVRHLIDANGKDLGEYLWGGGPGGDYHVLFNGGIWKLSNGIDADIAANASGESFVYVAYSNPTCSGTPAGLIYTPHTDASPMDRWTEARSPADPSPVNYKPAGAPVAMPAGNLYSRFTAIGPVCTLIEPYVTADARLLPIAVDANPPYWVGPVSFAWAPAT